MKKITTIQIITILTTILTITVNGLANALPLNGQATGEISDRFAIRFVPAGYVFSIWGLIYIGLIAFTIFQALPGQRDNQLLKKIAPAYWISNLANTAWIFLWHYEFFSLTLAVMVILLASLIYIYQQVSKDTSIKTGQARWFVQYPFSIYLGWISVATIANASQVLFYLNWDGWGISGPVWAAIMIAVATILGLAMQWREQDSLYGLVLVWAFIGIAVSQSAFALVANSAWTASATLALAVLVYSVQSRRVRRMI